MELTIFIAFILILVAFSCELIDSSLGMLYGTILSPALIIAGFNPLLVIPSLLISQAIAGFTASFFHHRFRNVEFKVKIRHPKLIINKIKEVGWIETIRKGLTNDLRAVVCLTILGVLATVTAAILAINISKTILNTYIGILVFIIGIIIVLGFSFKYSWKKILGLGTISSFNKGLSGGGFGPLVTGGQVISGRNGKNSIGATTLSEGPICLTGFLIYLFVGGISNWYLPLLLTIGAVSAAPIGAFLTSKLKSETKIKKILGILCICLGIWTLFKTWVI